MELITYAGWKNNIKLANSAMELVITLDVGPRVIRCAPPGGVNIFKEYSEQAGQSGEAQWMIRGGHRLWIAPEGDASYALDNSALTFEEKGNGCILIHCPPDDKNGWKKTLEIELHPTRPKSIIRHTLTNISQQPQQAALWALSVMAPGGQAILPMPPLGEHPRDLLPNQRIVVWPYASLSDPRFTWGTVNALVKQETTGKPTKFGALHQQGWAAYQRDGHLFAKTIAYEPHVHYPDMGVNFELFTDQNMLELESLSPTYTFAPGESRVHTEAWALIDWAQPATATTDLSPIVNAALA